MRTLLVQDDLFAARNLAKRLKADGIVVDVANAAAEAFELARHYDYDLIVTETSAAHPSGAELARRFRAARIATPILILCGGSDSATRVRAFTAGADDVLPTPFDADELLARMRAIVRRAKGFADVSLTVGPLTLRQDSHEVTVGGREVRLTGKEYAILELLVLRRGSVLTKDAFLNHIYGGMDEPEAKIIDVFICKLRKKLALAGAPQLITTVWGRGYMLRDSMPSPAVRPIAGPRPMVAASLTMTAA